MAAPPARVTEADFVRLAQLYGRHARVVDDDGEEFFPQTPSWSENDLAQATARRPGASAWYVVDRERLDTPTQYGTIAEVIQRVREAGGTVEERDGAVAVHVVAGITHTFGGLRVDERARVLDERGEPIPRLYAAGVDVGGISNGGYSSGLAAALVLGLAAAETAVAELR